MNIQATIAVTQAKHYIFIQCIHQIKKNTQGIFEVATYIDANVNTIMLNKPQPLANNLHSLLSTFSMRQ